MTRAVDLLAALAHAPIAALGDWCERAADTLRWIAAACRACP